MKPYYEDGQVAIYHGDCRDVLSTLEAVALVASDPPYGIAYEHGARKGGRRLGVDGISVTGDAEPFDPAHLLNVAPRIVLWGANHYADRLPKSAGWLVWDKRDGLPSNDQSDCELAWTNFLTTARTFSARWWGNLREGREQREGRFHVSQKPVALMSWCLRLDGGTGTVLDPYMGSGSTLVAAREQGRRAIGIEVEERYCEVAAKRLAQQTLFGHEHQYVGMTCAVCQRDMDGNFYDVPPAAPGGELTGVLPLGETVTPSTSSRSDANDSSSPSSPHVLGVDG